MAGGREARHCHPGGKEGTPGVWQCWGHTAQQDQDINLPTEGDSCTCPRRLSPAEEGLSTPWDPAEAAWGPHEWLWSCSPPEHCVHLTHTPG